MKVHEEGISDRTGGPLVTSTRHVVKKIPPELRIPKIHYGREKNLFKRLIMRWRHDGHFLRASIQFAFVLLCILIGVEFALFVERGTTGTGFYPRPPGVEGFLPISALISLSYWIRTGIVNSVHPSGLFILLAILGTGLLLKKAFCSWLCPIGTLSETLWMLGQKLFGRTITLPRWLDYPLRSLKYLLMGFFVLAVVRMEVPDLKAFIYSPYNKVADIKMYQFFAEISGVALWSVIGLVLLSVVIKNFWCRFLCPYGALLGMLSFLSPLKITRNAQTCIDCELCTRACPSNIRVHTATRVRSDECTACMECVVACPVKDTLMMKAGNRGPAVPPSVFALLVVGLFVGITGAAMLTGFWENGISKEEYMRRMQNIHAPVYQHFRGEVPAYGPED